MAAKPYGDTEAADADLKFALAHGVREETASIAPGVPSLEPSLSSWWNLLSSPFSTTHEISGSQAVTSKPANIPTRFPDSLVRLLQRVSPSRLGSSVNIQQVVVDYLDAMFDSSPAGKQFLGQIGSLLELTPVPRQHDLAKILSVVAGVSVKMQPGTTFWLDELLQSHEDLQGDEFFPWLTKRMPQLLLQSTFGFNLATQIVLYGVTHLKVTAGNGSFATEYVSYTSRSSPVTGTNGVHVDSKTASGLPPFGQIESFKKSEVRELEATLGRPLGPISVPDYFPGEITTMIHMIPLVMVGETPHDVQRIAMELISGIFDSQSSDSVACLQQLARLLGQAPLGFSQDVGKLLISFVMACVKLKPHESISVHELAQQTDTPWRNGFLQYLSAVPNTTLEQIFGLPITADYLVHLLSHMELRSQGSKSEVTLSFTHCESGLHRPQPNPALIEQLINSLPGVPLDSLAEDDRSCGVCRGGYGELGNFLNNEPEEPARLPCGHHFGKSCITVVLSPKPTGWAHTSCPLCRQPIALLPITPLGNLLGLTKNM
ncbi:hypothetical protein G7Y79_00078g100030 [Physcia stellaris]|nr:hypothetical protein G7Y79_00078g100030 [Physcia stellaris]